ncbi:MAG TPA: catalase family peroxidase [Stellaceae bacterium]|nr:catalase family peroxidase [Stellaceae bacterium]
MLWSNSAWAAVLRPTLIALALAAAVIGPLPAWAADAGTPAAVQAASLASELVAALDRVFQGPHPGKRAIHTKGIVLRGTFTADPDAMSLSSAEHLRPDAPPVPIIVRFSDFSGIPTQRDGKPGAGPAGMSIKFQLPGGVDTDIVAHAFNGFPVATPEDFLGYLNALASNDPQLREAFFASHPAAKQFADAPKPTPVSYGTETYYGVDAFRFVNAAAVSRFGRYRIEPVAGNQFLGAAATADIQPDYLHDEMKRRLATAPVRFRLLVQIAEPEDPVTDATKPWPDDRPAVTLGTLSLAEMADDESPEVKTLFFNPMNLVPGIAPSADPLLAARTRTYTISYRRRLAGQ